MYIGFSESLLFFQEYKERRDEDVCNNNVNYISSLKHWAGKSPENLKAFKYKDNDWPPYGNTKHPDYKLVVVLTVDSPGLELVEELLIEPDGYIPDTYEYVNYVGMQPVVVLLRKA